MASRAPYADEAFELLPELEERSAWFRSRNELVKWALRRYFPNARRLVDVGCGTGFVLAGISRGFPQLELTAVDRAPRALEIARSRVPSARFECADVSSLPYDAVFDVACALDVLEHLDDDDAAIAELRRVVVPGGGVVLTAPQHPWLWGGMDEYAQHRRRYRRRELSRKVRKGGLELRRETSFVSLPLPALAVTRLRSRWRADYDLAADLARSPRLERALGGVLALERRSIELGVSWPFGGSVLVVATRPRRRVGDDSRGKADRQGTSWNP